MPSYQAAKPDEYLAITGAYIKDVKISKKAMIWPYQKVSLLSMLYYDCN